jgi:hypothetical protein
MFAWQAGQMMAYRRTYDSGPGRLPGERLD